MNKILYVTTSRADYWIMRPLLLSLKDNVNLEILISGMHLLKDYGNTQSQVKNDFKNAKVLEIDFTRNNNKYDILDIMTNIQKEFTIYLRNNHIDYLMLLGDRSEILPFAICASILNIPIIHLHGGEITYGAYDEFIRHCITKMSSLHLTSTEVYKKRVMQMGESNVYNIGSLGSNNAHHFVFNQDIVPNYKYVVILYHPETIKDDKDEIHTILNVINKLNNLNIKPIFIGCNNDVGGNHYNNKVKEYCTDNNFQFYPSLSSNDWFSLVSKSECLIGNSSSGIIEIPCLCKPIVNIGNRQNGREKSKYIINCECSVDSIYNAIIKAFDLNKIEHDNPYCNKNVINDAKKIMLEFINKKHNIKEFIDLKI